MTGAPDAAAGASLLVNGIGGGVGIAVAQIARGRGQPIRPSAEPTVAARARGN